MNAKNVYKLYKLFTIKTKNTVSWGHTNGTDERKTRGTRYL